MQSVIWDNINKFDVNETSNGNGFALRLARENNWSYNFTKQAIDEYKKFMFLAATSDFMVSPSHITDQVWHLHLTYTKSYTDFCTLLGKRIEHLPSNYTNKDIIKFRTAKEKTKIVYEKQFGQQPKEFWIYTSIYDQLNLEKAKYKFRSKIVFLLLLLILIYYPIYMISKGFIRSIENPNFILFEFILFISTLLLLEIVNFTVVKSLINKLNTKSFLFDLTSLEMIYFKYGNLYNVIKAVLNNLIIENKIKIKKVELFNYKFFSSINFNPSNEPILDYVKEEGSKLNYIVSNTTNRPVYKNIVTFTNAVKKYFLKAKVISNLMLFNGCFFWLNILFCFLRLTNGVINGKNVGFLLFYIVLITVASAFYLTFFYNRFIKKEFSNYYDKLVKSNTLLNTNLGWNYYLNSDESLCEEFKALLRHDNGGSTSSDSSGSSCGSSCGGGCGGCGGGD